jgi:chaperonin GroEL
MDSLSSINDEQYGISIVRKALEEPIRQIVANAGLEPSIVVNKIISENGAFGFNALTNQYEDLIKAGVIDPTKVARTALENAASIAGLMLTTEAVVCDKPEKKNASGYPGMPSDMDMY